LEREKRTELKLKEATTEKPSLPQSLINI